MIKPGPRVSELLFGSWLHSLRRQCAFVLMILMLLMLAYGFTAIYALHQASTATRELAERRLARLQTAQNLVWQTVSAARLADQLEAAAFSENTQVRYADLVQQLNRIDQLVDSINGGDTALGVLDLQQADQLFISTANTLVQQSGMLSRDREAFEHAYKLSMTELQSRSGLTNRRAASILSLTATTNDVATVQQLRVDALRLPGWVSPWRNDSLDPFGLRLTQVRRIGIINRLADALHQQTFRMMDAAREQSDYFTEDYRRAVNQLADTTQRQQYWVLAFLTGSLLVAWMIGYLFLGMHVLGRLRIVSRYLRLDRTLDQTPRVPVAGHDEIAGMARAVEGFLEDRNQLHRARASLEASESRLAAIIQYAADGFVIVQDGLIRQLNPAAEQLLGWQPGDAPRLDLTDLQRRIGNAAQYDSMACSSGGEMIPVEVSVSEVQLLTGPVQILVIRDARLRREAERQLTEAKDAAEAARSAQAAFLANMSHEFRTPLNAIIGYAQILKRDDGLSERQHRGLNTIEQSGEHLLLLVNDILDLAQIEAGRLDLFPTQVDLNNFLRVMADIIVVKTEQKSLLFNSDWPPGLPAVVNADEKRLRQVLLNLLGNAVKFTSRGHVTLRVRWHALDDTQGILRFEVADTGVGIAQEQLQHIFERFTQVGETSARLSGTGLGLPISRHLLLLMGSDLQVRSRIGEGSVFCFELTLPYGGSGAAVAWQLPVVGYRGGKRRLLVIDDGEDNRSMLETMLSELGFEILLANDGLAGVEMARTAQPDLIVMDAMMPMLDGPAATRQIRALPGSKRIPIIIVSADVTQDNQRAALEAGADAFLGKPLRQDELTQLLGRLLDLEWDYAKLEVKESHDAVLQPPPQADLAALYLLAQLGDLQQIQHYAAELAGRDAQYRPFAERLAQLAAGLRSKAVLQLIKQYLDGEAP